jgi:glycerophosphoryl diester phosphodiesterase
VPTLEEVIELVRGKMKINVELKYNVPDPELAPAVIDLLRRENFLDNVVITYPRSWASDCASYSAAPRPMSPIRQPSSSYDRKECGKRFRGIERAVYHRYPIVIGR